MSDFISLAFFTWLHGFFLLKILVLELGTDLAHIFLTKYK